MAKPTLQIIIASTRPGRVGPSVAAWFHDRAVKAGDFEVELIDLAEVNLPMFDEPKHPRFGDYVHQHTKDWSATITRGDAYVFVIPEYNYKLTSNALRPPESVVRCHLPNQRDCLVREPRFARAGFRCVLPKHTEELTRPSQQRLRLDDKERLFPGPNHSREKYQEHSICFPVNWSCDLSTQDNELVSQQRVFRQQFGFASGQISKRSGHKGGRQWFDPTPNTFLERVQAKTDALLDREEIDTARMEPLLYENKRVVRAYAQNGPR